MLVGKRSAPSRGLAALETPPEIQAEGRETYLDADVELDVCVGVLDGHGCGSVDVDDLMGGGLVGVACCYAEDVVVRHVEALAMLNLCVVCCCCVVLVTSIQVSSLL